MADANDVKVVTCCLEGISCVVRDFDGDSVRCDTSVHSCVTCGVDMHAICGNAAEGEEEG